MWWRDKYPLKPSTGLHVEHSPGVDLTLFSGDGRVFLAWLEVAKVGNSSAELKSNFSYVWYPFRTEAVQVLFWSQCLWCNIPPSEQQRHRPSQCFTEEIIMSIWLTSPNPTGNIYPYSYDRQYHRMVKSMRLFWAALKTQMFNIKKVLHCAAADRPLHICLFRDGGSVSFCSPRKQSRNPSSQPFILQSLHPYSFFQRQLIQWDLCLTPSDWKCVFTQTSCLIWC